LNERRADFAQLADGDRLRMGGYLIAVSLVNQDCILNFKKIT
jgi:predicted component of type VI protein secretion system